MILICYKEGDLQRRVQESLHKLNLAVSPQVLEANLASSQVMPNLDESASVAMESNATNVIV